MPSNLIRNCLFGLLACTASTAALAQYAWIDGRGVRQYSDQPPPASISKARILQQPAVSLRNNAPVPTPAPVSAGAAGAAGIDAATAPAVAPTASAAVATATPPKLPPTIADKNADYLKRQAESAEKEKRLAEDARLAAAKARQCEQARSYARSLESGERISVVDKNGERGYMSDEKRAQEVADAKRMQEACK